MLKKLFLSLTVAGLAITSIAANNTNSLFNAGEVGISLDGGYILNDYPDTKSTTYTTEKKGKKTVVKASTVTTDNDDYDILARVGVFYFPVKNFGASVFVPIYTTDDGLEVNTVDVALIARIALLDAFAPYCKVGTSYQWQNEEYDYFGAVGVEYRLSMNWGVYSEVNYQVKDFDTNNSENGQTTLRLGVSYVF